VVKGKQRRAESGCSEMAELSMMMTETADFFVIYGGVELQTRLESRFLRFFIEKRLFDRIFAVGEPFFVVFY